VRSSHFHFINYINLSSLISNIIIIGLCIPANNSTFIIQLSDKLAISETGLTLEFLTEFFVGFYKSSTPQKHLCLQYMAPWLSNLALYYRNGAEHIAKTKVIIKNLIEMTTKEPEVLYA
jgi:hypothetical protein